MANTKLPARLLDTSAIPALNVTGDLTVDTTTLKVDSTNNKVGIGIASPVFPLHVNSSSTDVAKFQTSGSYAYTRFQNSSKTWALSVGSDFGFYDEAASATRMVIDSSGKVGIGANPLAKLHLGGTAPGDSIIRQDATSSGTNWEIGERTAGKYQFWEDDGDNVRLTIMSTGNVGIGTTSPAYKLDLHGAMRIQNSRATFVDASEDATASGHIFVSNDGVGDFSQEAGHLVIQARTHTSVYRDIIFAGGINNASDLMRITGEGSVNIPFQLSVPDVRGPTTTDQYLTFGASRTLRIRSSSGAEYLRVSDSAAGGIISVGYNNHTAINTMAAIHGLANDATLVLSNNELSGSNASYGWRGRGGRVLHSNGTGWTDSNAASSDGSDPALVVGSNNNSGSRTNIGVLLHNDSPNDDRFSPMIAFGNKSNSGSYNTVYGAIIGKKTGQGGDANWSTGEIHMDTSGVRNGTNSRTAYMDDDPAFRIDEHGDITMPYRAYAYGHWTGSSFSVTNNTGFPMNVLRYQNMTYQNNATHGYGMTIVKPGLYQMHATGLYDPGGTYIYVGWCVNGVQEHHWHSNHAISNNHDYVSTVMIQLNVGDHITFENASQVMTTAWGGGHSYWYIAKFG